MAGREFDIEVIRDIAERMTSLGDGFVTEVSLPDAGSSIGPGYDSLQTIRDSLTSMNEGLKELINKTSSFFRVMANNIQENDEREASSIGVSNK